MQKQMAPSRVSSALKHSVPAAADQAYEPGDEVLVWRENVVNSLIGEWVGPYPVLGMDAIGKIVYVQDAQQCMPFQCRTD